MTSTTNPAGAETMRPGGLPYGLRKGLHGLFLYNRNDTYVGRSLQHYGEFSEAEFQVLRQLCKPGDWVLDVGANIGAHTVPLARRVGPQGRVIAFEPQRLIFQMLAANVALNGLTNVVTHWAAVGAAEGSILVPELDHARVNNFGGIPVGADRGEPVRLLRLDDLGLTRCNLMKIDVEGFELEVLKGASETLSRLRPRLYVENDRRDKSPALIRHLLDLGYRLFWSLPPLFRQDNFAGKAENIWEQPAKPGSGRIVSVNMLCLPPDDATKVVGLRPVEGPEDDWRRPAAHAPEATGA